MEQNASQVIEPERERKLDKDAPSGAAESLVGHAIPKMGGRSVVVTNIDKSSEDKKEDLYTTLLFCLFVQKTSTYGRW